MMLKRAIKLPSDESFFLLGPRQTGKSTLIQARYPNSVWKVDFLLNDIFFAYSKDPSLFRKQALEKIQKEKIKIIFIDEVQRIPNILYEVQWLIQETKCQFILTGSSARKLKRGGANLLAGRALQRHLHPFIYEEIRQDFDLDTVLKYGSLPFIYDLPSAKKREFLEAYVNIYLREEIQSEGLARNLGGFSRFLDIAASQNGELLSFSNVARDAQLPVRTVQSYYEILEDTLLGFRLEPWRKSLRKRLSAHPKFYFFDMGVTNAILRRLSSPLDPAAKGRMFEQWLILETLRLLDYGSYEANLYYWRTNHGSEVDLIIEKHGRILAGIEFKSSSHIARKHTSGLQSFAEDYPEAKRLLACSTEHAFKLEDVHVLPWKEYLKEIPELLK